VQQYPSVSQRAASPYPRSAWPFSFYRAWFIQAGGENACVSSASSPPCAPSTSLVSYPCICSWASLLFSLTGITGGLVSGSFICVVAVFCCITGVWRRHTFSMATMLLCRDLRCYTGIYPPPFRLRCLVTAASSQTQFRTFAPRFHFRLYFPRFLTNL